MDAVITISHYTLHINCYSKYTKHFRYCIVEHMLSTKSEHKIGGKDCTVEVPLLTLFNNSSNLCFLYF